MAFPTIFSKCHSKLFKTFSRRIFETYAEKFKVWLHKQQIVILRMQPTMDMRLQDRQQLVGFNFKERNMFLKNKFKQLFHRQILVVKFTQHNQPFILNGVRVMKIWSCYVIKINFTIK